MPELQKSSFDYKLYKLDELSDEEKGDIAMAHNARSNAYAPYSNFMVGALIRTNKDRLFKGWNVENVAYNGLHAEENALGRLGQVDREVGIKRVTVVGAPRGAVDNDPVTPCGSCRQKLLEIIGPGDNPVVLCGGINSRIIKVLLGDLLPLGFFPAVLKTNA